MNNIWLVSDTHFNHEMLIEEKLRPFRTAEEMNETIVRMWNAHVEPEDTVYFIGDFAFGEDKHKWLQLLNGDITIIRGNHDPNSLSKITALEITWEGYTLLLIHNPADTEWFPTHDIVIHGHIHKSGYRTFQSQPGVVYANVNLEFHKYRPKLINEVVGMIVNNMEAEWITYGN